MNETELPPLRALIVDDDVACARAVGQMLQRAGASSLEMASSAEAAMERLAVAEYDVILCDLTMPGRDGVETLRMFAERHVKSPIVLISGADPKVLKAAQELGKSRGLGVAGTLHKPFGFEQLRTALSHVAAVASPRSRRPQPRVSPDELACGIELEQLVLHYQPQLNLHGCHLEGAEALVRWQHPERGLLMPDAFIGVAESSGLIEPLTDWVLGEAIRQAAEWRRGGVDMGVSVNLSAKNLRQLDLPDRISEAAEREGIAPRRVTLEVTESGVSDDLDSLLDITTRLRLKGFLLAIDDFGTGFSSLSQLRRLPFTELKLDRTFVSGACTDADARSVLESSVNLAKRLQLKTVAEGIETQEEWNLLVWMGVDLGQGYHMARPMPADKLLPWYAGWQAQVA